MEDHVGVIANIGGFAVGCIFGIFAQSSRFCFFSALKRVAHKDRDTLVPSVLIAMAVGLLSTQVLRWIFDLDLHNSIYLSTSPSLLAMVVGALVFSLGMILANGCPNRHVILLATGNLRSLVVILVMGVSSYMTIRGLLSQPRVWLEENTVINIDNPSLDGLLHAITGIHASLSTLLVTAILSGSLFAAAWWQRPKKNNVYHYFAACILGVSVSAGWYVTGYLGYDEFDPKLLQSISFTSPPGEALLYLMIWSGSTLTFTISLVFGVLAGSLSSSILTKNFRWQAYENIPQMKRSIIGSVLMGFGAVTSFGCTVGQGMSGFSTMSLSSLLVVFVMFFSSVFLMKRFS